MFCNFFQNLPLHTHLVLTESEKEEELEVNLSDLRVPLQNGWQRETVMQGLTKSKEIRGDVYYYAPGSQIKLENIGQIEKVD